MRTFNTPFIIEYGYKALGVVRVGIAITALKTCRLLLLLVDTYAYFLLVPKSHTAQYTIISRYGLSGVSAFGLMMDEYWLRESL